MHMLQESLWIFRKPVEEDIYCLLDTIVELIHDCDVEEFVE